MSRSKNNSFTPIGIENKLNTAWSEVNKCISRISTDCKIKANHRFCCASATTNKEVISVIVDPIVFMLPEDSDSSKNIIAVVKGSICFCKENINNNLRSSSFDTELEIYRMDRKNGEKTLSHVFGVLYHFDSEKFDHPLFHAHITDEIKMGDQIESQFSQFKDVMPKSKISGIMRNVRLPTAQLDVFSVIVQLCADHMIKTKSEIHKKNFEKLKKYCNCFQSAESYLTRNINGDKDNTCLRAVHWYGP